MLYEIQLNDGSAVFALDVATQPDGEVSVHGTCVRVLGRSLVYWPIQSADIRSKLIGYVACMTLDAAEKDEGYARILKVMRGEKLDEPEEK
jgi:hypothetical protein